MIVAVISEKGGTGKTTIAAHLAGWRKATGSDVMLVDGDRQGTATYWVDVRNELGLPTPSTVQAFQRSLRRSVMDLTRHYDEIVVDVGAGDGVGMESILRIADLAVLPLQPNELDIWTVGLLDELAGDASAVNESLTVKAVLNRAPTHHANTDAQAAHAALLEWSAYRCNRADDSRALLDTPFRSGRKARERVATSRSQGRAGARGPVQPHLWDRDAVRRARQCRSIDSAFRRQEMTMNIRRRGGAHAERASGHRVGSGRRRTVDVDENHNYHPVAFRVSDSLYRKLRPGCCSIRQSNAAGVHHRGA